MKGVLVTLVIFFLKYAASYDLDYDTTDNYFIDDNLEEKQERVCTYCTDEYPNCRDEYFRLEEQYGSSDDFWWHVEGLTKENVYLSCLDYNSHTVRRKRSLGSNRNSIHGKSGHRNRRDYPEVHHGLIYINRALSGLSKSADKGDCDAALDASRDQCVRNALTERSHLIECNGRYECLGLALPGIADTDCTGIEQETDFLQVDYQCIPDELSMSVDEYDTITSPEGYLMSTNYPEEYTPQCSYQCLLSATDYHHHGDFKVHVQPLDFLLQDETDGCCTADWLEVQSINKYNEIVEKHRYCGYVDPSELLAVKTENSLRFLFVTNTDTQDRGFWIKYSAFDDQDESLNVTVSCYTYYPTYDYLTYNDSQSDYIPSCHKESTTRKTSTTDDSHESSEEITDDDALTTTTTPVPQTTKSDIVTTHVPHPQTTSDSVIRPDTTKQDNADHTTEYQEISNAPQTPSTGLPKTSTPAPGDGSSDAATAAAQESGSSATVGIAIGAAMGGLVVIAVVIATAVLCLRNRSQTMTSNSGKGPAFENPYYLPATQAPGKPPLSHTMPSPPKQTAFQNPDYQPGYLYPVPQAAPSSGYLYPVTQPNSNGVQSNQAYDNPQYEEIPDTGSSFGVKPSEPKMDASKPQANDTKSGGYTSLRGNPEENVYQELSP